MCRAVACQALTGGSTRSELTCGLSKMRPWLMGVQGVGFAHVSACVTMSVQEKGVPSQISLSFVQVFCATVSICSTIWLKSAAILLGFPSIGIRSIKRHRTCLSLCFRVELTMTMKDQLKVICEKLNHEKWKESRLRGLSLFWIIVLDQSIEISFV